VSTNTLACILVDQTNADIKEALSGTSIDIKRHHSGYDYDADYESDGDSSTVYSFSSSEVSGNEVMGMDLAADPELETLLLLGE
jgi:hypothetical protein